MTTPTDLALTRHLAALPDPRVDRTKKHLLGDILLITLCATIAGADSWQEVERFGRVKLSWLQQFLKLPHGIPSHDTFRRLFARIDPKAFNRCMAGWMAGLCEATGLRHVAIDGKAARSCTVAMAAVDGVKVVTIEGLDRDGNHPVQKAWRELSVPQCGYCQSGQIMSAAALLASNKKPSDDQIREAMDGNICRCGCYQRIIAAVRLTANGA